VALQGYIISSTVYI